MYSSLLIIPQVGAHFLETVVRQFDEVYKNPSETKECDNLISIICHLYNFQVVHSVLVFDILKHLVGDFREKDIELVLLVLRNVGFALRKDDALALKELICEGQRKAVDVGTKFQDQTRVTTTTLCTLKRPYAAFWGGDMIDSSEMSMSIKAFIHCVMRIFLASHLLE